MMLTYSISKKHRLSEKQLKQMRILSIFLKKTGLYSDWIRYLSSKGTNTHILIKKNRGSLVRMLGRTNFTAFINRQYGRCVKLPPGVFIFELFAGFLKVFYPKFIGLDDVISANYGMDYLIINKEKKEIKFKLPK